MRLLLATLCGLAAAEDAPAPYCTGHIEDIAPCNTHSCTVQNCTAEDAAWGDWEEWGHCDCNSFVRERGRPIGVHAKCGGVQISGPQVSAEPCVPDASKTCTIPETPVACATSEWSSWSKCECGSPQVFRTRVYEESAHCGKPCTEVLKETAPCDQDQFSACNPVQDCTYSKWGNWTKCPVTCGGGQQIRERGIEHPAQNGGSTCKEPLSMTRPCNENCCAGTEPINCKWDEWAEWGDCSAECEGGTRSRSRDIGQYARNGGGSCPPGNMQEFERCNMQSCNPRVPVDGKFGGWSEWGACTDTCGGGYMSRMRMIEVAAKRGGKPLSGPLEEFQRCNTDPCNSEDASDCEFSEWTPWTECSCDCNGKRAQQRDILVHGKNGGKVCEGGLSRWEACNTPGSGASGCQETKPKAECTFQPWSNWTACSASCEGGTQTRSREANTGADIDDACSGATSEVQPCNGIPCYMLGDPVDCVWEDWTSWGDCTRSCGGGEKSSYRKVETGAKYAGKPCDASGSMKVTGCNENPCAVTAYCAWAEWTPWGDCSAECNGGERTRSKSLETRDADNVPDEYLDSYSLAQLTREVKSMRSKMSGLQVMSALGIATAVTGVAVFASRALDRRGAPTAEEVELLNAGDRAAE